MEAQDIIYVDYVIIIMFVFHVNSWRIVLWERWFLNPFVLAL